MSVTDQISGGFQNFWSLDVPNYQAAGVSLRDDYDAIVVGAGYSGLAVAMGLARRGLSVLVLDKHGVGHGCSSRNGGMVGPSFHKLGMTGLTRKYGVETAERIMRAGIDALGYCQEFFASEAIDCDFSMTGRFRGARNVDDLRAMVAECERLKAAVGLEYEPVTEAEMHKHIGSTAYCGGVFYPKDGGLHPKRLVNALALRAEVAGAHILIETPVLRLVRDGGKILVRTQQGTMTARHVIIATNGYSNRGTAVMNDRVVPIDVSVAATRNLGTEQVRTMSPGLTMHGESGRVFIWSRPTPDHRRFIFGGRISTPSASLDRQRRQIATAVSRIFPDLAPTDFEHVWHGKVAYTTDHAPHLGQIDGIWLLGGYCGSGVTRSLFFADKIVRRITGQAVADTPFDALPFPRVPFRALAPFGARQLSKYYEWLDACENKVKCRKAPHSKKYLSGK